MSGEAQVGDSIVLDVTESLCASAVSKSDLANLEKVTPLRQIESFKQDEFDKAAGRQTVVTISPRING